MFNVGDIVRHKKAVGPNNIICYGIVTHVENNPSNNSLSLIKVQWLNWQGGTMRVYQFDAQKWWEKVEE